MAASVSILRCAGCGYEAPASDPFPFRCPRSQPGDDIDHLFRRSLDRERLGSAEELRAVFLDSERNPFLKFRRLFHGYRAGREAGMTDADFVRLVETLDREVAEVDGAGFRTTPLYRAAPLGRTLGLDEIWVKDETGNVSGSHKARHLMGVMIWLQVMELLGRVPEDSAGATLAIASCGNAALAAAVIARAAGRRIRVFIPTHARSAVVRRLADLGAILTRCPRDARYRGDPAYRKFHQAIDRGALAFSCQGPDNGLAIEGGATLAWELLAELDRQGGAIDRLFVQVGGGALASGVMQGFREALDLGLIGRLPRFHAVQTSAASPLLRAWNRLTERLLCESGAGAEEIPESPAERSRLLAEATPAPDLEAALRYAATHRSEFMWPWEDEPRSVAYSILDDETYDWLAILEGMLATGGYPVTVSEERLLEANQLGRRGTRIPVDPSGSSGLAGCIELRESGELDKSESVAVLFTGVERPGKSGEPRDVKPTRRSR